MHYNDYDRRLFRLTCFNISFTHGLKSVNDSSYDSLVYCVIVMVSGKIMFGFVLSSVTSALASTEALRSGFEEKVKETQVGIVIGKFLVSNLLSDPKGCSHLFCSCQLRYPITSWNYIE